MANKSEPNRLQTTSHPLLYEINTRVLLRELSASHGKPLTLATIPDRVLDEWADLGFDAVWLMGVWTTGSIAARIARTTASLREGYAKVLSDVSDEDIVGSPYSVKVHTVSAELGGRSALLSLRKKLEKRGLGLILDFVCNHTARDCAWISQHPEYFVQGVPGEEVSAPEYYFKTKTVKGEKVFAFGRDPYFPGWTDSAQLNYRHPQVRRVQIDTLKKIATLCDGVRCDMAMLLLEEVFHRTWGERCIPTDCPPAEGEFWKDAISEVKAKHQNFLFLAEVYWNLEWRLQQLGFDYTYDKTLYDRLLREGASSVYDHLKAEIDFQRHSLRFIENHDEPRAMASLPSEGWHFAAATIASTVPGMVLFHDGQLEGRMVKSPVQLCRRSVEQTQPQVTTFYRRLLQCLRSEIFRHGSWRLLTVKPAWHDNYTWTNFIAYWWQLQGGGVRCVVVNYAPHNGQCYVELQLDEIEAPRLEFRDLMSSAVYVRERSALNSKGMYFDLPGYGFHVFDVAPAQRPAF